MQYQNIDGHIFNIDGAGADGNPTGNYAAYGATKYAIVQLNRSLSQELKQQNIDNIGSFFLLKSFHCVLGIHILSPGMCITDLLMCTELSKETRFFINCLGMNILVDFANFWIQRNILKCLQNIWCLACVKCPAKTKGTIFKTAKLRI